VFLGCRRRGAPKRGRGGGSRSPQCMVPSKYPLVGSRTASPRPLPSCCCSVANQRIGSHWKAGWLPSQAPLLAEVRPTTHNPADLADRHCSSEHEARLHNRSRRCRERQCRRSPPRWSAREAHRGEPRSDTCKPASRGWKTAERRALRSAHREAVSGSPLPSFGFVEPASRPCSTDEYVVDERRCRRFTHHVLPWVSVPLRGMLRAPRSAGRRATRVPPEGGTLETSSSLFDGAVSQNPAGHGARQVGSPLPVRRSHTPRSATGDGRPCSCVCPR
jgi:hypothetical protein